PLRENRWTQASGGNTSLPPADTQLEACTRAISSIIPLRQVLGGFRAHCESEYGEVGRLIGPAEPSILPDHDLQTPWKPGCPPGARARGLESARARGLGDSPRCARCGRSGGARRRDNRRLRELRSRPAAGQAGRVPAWDAEPLAAVAAG